MASDHDPKHGEIPTAPPPETPRVAPWTELTIVGCGASAGGLEAFTQLLDAMSPEVAAAVVLVQHLSPKSDSMLPDLLQPHTRMSVREARDGVRLEPHTIYVAQPGTLIALDDGCLRVQRRPDTAPNLPIDFLFRSLAEVAAERAIGVVLSGTGTDGAAGVRDIKASGGIAMAQMPEAARFDGMPIAAIATGMVDIVLPCQGLADEICRIAGATPPPALEDPPAAGSIDRVQEEQLQRIFAMLRSASGVDFRHYKMPTISRRLQRRLVLHKLTRLEDYVRLMRENPEEVLALYRDILIHVTRFFREATSFDALVEQVFPRLIEEHHDDLPIRAWVAGCSTGEEAYSLAIRLLECLGDRAGQVPMQIFATDVSEEAIQQARTGLYPPSIAADVSPERLRRFFNKVDGGYRIAKPVRDVCVFARQDLTRDPPFSKLDLVLCRNVLIYLSAPLQRRLMSVFHYALRPGRFLMLGHAETIGSHADLFQLQDRKHRIYAKKAVELGASNDFSLDYPAQREAPARHASPPHDDDRIVQSETTRLLLERYAPPGVVVDDDLQIAQFCGQTGLFLESPPGDPTVDLYKMAREGLLHGLREAVTSARGTGRPARREGLHVRRNGGRQAVDVEVLPLLGVRKPHFLVVFESPRTPIAVPGAAVDPADTSQPTAPADDTVRRLNEELAASRTYLQSIIQELEAANEGLQSANEEILSSNEELQSTNEELDTAKEELQSTNEELNTVNEELHARNDDLTRANSDLVNILSSVQIAILIVSRDLRIRRFTPMAERKLNLIATDVGRPIGHIKPDIDCPDLEEVIHEVIENVSVVERRVQDKEGTWFSLRIRPYKSVDNRIDGAVLALLDVDAQRRREQELREMRDYAEAIVRGVHQPIVVVDGDLRVRTANPAFLTLLGADGDVVGRRLVEVFGGRDQLSALRELASGSDGGGSSTRRMTVDVDRTGAPPRRMTLDARLVDIDGGRRRIVVIALQETPPVG